MTEKRYTFEEDPSTVVKLERYENKKIKNIGMYGLRHNRYGGVDDEFAPPVEIPFGPSFSFYENGAVKQVQFFSNPVLDPKYSPAEVYKEEPVWSETFDEKGKLTKVVGRPNLREFHGFSFMLESGEFMFETLKKEKLMTRVTEALSLDWKSLESKAQHMADFFGALEGKKLTLRSTLSKGTKASSKTPKHSEKVKE